MSVTATDDVLEISMSMLPTGVVTFLLSDVEDSTRLWLEHRENMREAIARHDSLFAELVTEAGGILVKPRGEGDSHFTVFSRPSSAVRASAILQCTLTGEPWAGGVPLRIRMALHTGETDVRDDDYYGLAPSRCGRLRSIAHGGQVVLSNAIAELVIDSLPDGLTLRSLGTHQLRGLSRPERVWQLCGAGLREDFPALASMGPVPHDLVTILVTDVVGSTRFASEVGNRRHRQWLDEHDALAKVELQRFGGRLWSITEDSVLASFDSARRALGCACALRDGVAGLGAGLRVGVHAGEVEVRGDRLDGIAVHIASRLSRLAQGGEILLSRTVSDLLAGSEVSLEDRGDFELRGIAGQWRVYALHE